MLLYHCPLNPLKVQTEVTLSFKCQFGLCVGVFFHPHVQYFMLSIGWFYCMAF